MWWLADPKDLHRISDRLSSVYVDRCHIDRDDNAVVLVNRERTIRVPAAMVATLLLGPGTRITNAAVRLLADSGTAICWVGEYGVRFYASGLGPSRSGELLLRQAYLVTRTKERLAVARRMFGMRFPGEDVSTATMQQLRGREGARVKKIYRNNPSELAFRGTDGPTNPANHSRPATTLTASYQLRTAASTASATRRSSDSAPARPRIHPYRRRHLLRTRHRRPLQS